MSIESYYLLRYNILPLVLCNLYLMGLNFGLNGSPRGTQRVKLHLSEPIFTLKPICIHLEFIFNEKVVGVRKRNKVEVHF